MVSPKFVGDPSGVVAAHVLSKSARTNNGAEVFIAFLFIVPVTFYQGFVAMKLWQWHVAPVFHAPPLSLGHAVGLSVFLGFLTARASAPTNDKGPLEVGILQVCVASVALLVGWLAAF
jgi:hypothetical protein